MMVAMIMKTSLAITVCDNDEDDYTDSGNFHHDGD